MSSEMTRKISSIWCIPFSKLIYTKMNKIMKIMLSIKNCTFLRWWQYPKPTVDPNHCLNLTVKCSLPSPLGASSFLTWKVSFQRIFTFHSATDTSSISFSGPLALVVQIRLLDFMTLCPGQMKANDSMIAPSADPHGSCQSCCDLSESSMGPVACHFVQSFQASLVAGIGWVLK